MNSLLIFSYRSFCSFLSPFSGFFLINSTILPQLTMHLILLLTLLPFVSCTSSFHPSVSYRPTIPENARKLSGSDLTSYVNNHQKLWKAETSRMTFQEKMVNFNDYRTQKSRILIVFRRVSKI